MEFSVNSLEEMCDLMCGSIEREENMISKDFATNVLMILRHNGTKIGEFEKKMGFCAGYLSRVANGTNRALSLDYAWDICDELNMDIEVVITTDWKKEFEEDDRLKKIEELEAEQQKIAEMLRDLKS